MIWINNLLPETSGGFHEARWDQQNRKFFIRVSQGARPAATSWDTWEGQGGCHLVTVQMVWLTSWPGQSSSRSSLSLLVVENGAVLRIRKGKWFIQKKSYQKRLHRGSCSFIYSFIHSVIHSLWCQTHCCWLDKSWTAALIFPWRVFWFGGWNQDIEGKCPVLILTM